MIVDQESITRFRKTCEMTAEYLRTMAPLDRDRLRRLYLAMTSRARFDAMCSRIEDRILVLLEWSHHGNCPGHLEAACQLAHHHGQELDWDDLNTWAERLNFEWAIPRLRDAARCA